MSVKIWTGDGSMIDGSIEEDRESAIETIRKYRGWSTVYAAEHCDGSAVSVYETEEDSDNDIYGSYADTVSDID